MTASIFPTAPAQRYPASVFGSLALHGAAIGLYLYTVQLSHRQATRQIANVDLMIQVKKPVASAAPRPAAPPPNMMNFLKMALPAIPKIEAQRLDVKVPQHELKMQTPKLQDRGHLERNKLQALKLDERRMDEAPKLDVGAVKSRRSASQLAALPKLEEVGHKRIKNLPDAIKLDEERQQAVAQMRMDALTTPTHHHVAAMGETLHEAAPSESSKFASKIAAMLPTQPPPLEARPEMRAADDNELKKKVFMEPAKRHDQAQGLDTEKKKGVELEGPIQNRKIVSYDVPEFPSWAKDQGIMEASVAIRFWVTPQGDVLDNMRVERTSGFGRLDRMAMDALKNWKFAPLLNNEKQWGVITFRFVLE